MIIKVPGRLAAHLISFVFFFFLIVQSSSPVASKINGEHLDEVQLLHVLGVCLTAWSIQKSRRGSQQVLNPSLKDTLVEKKTRDKS